MASIATAISLNDNFSRVANGIISVTNRMTSAIDNTANTMNRNVTSASFDSVAQSVDRATNEVNQLNQAVSNTSSGIGNAGNQQESFNNKIRSGESAMNGLVNKVMGLVGAYLSLQGVKKLMDVSDELVSSKARLDMMNDGLQTTDELFGMVYQAAQNSRGELGTMASVVAKFGNNAKDAFKSSREVVAFSELVQKQMTIAGASTSEASNAMLQLSQALGSGVLRGDELNSIFEQAPNLVQSIADYLDVPIGQIRAMAQEGQLSADIVKNAIFASADDINAKFEQMPMTWAQLWTSFANKATVAFEPVLQKVNELANNEKFQAMLDSILNGLAMIANAALWVVDVIANNWDIIAPIILGIAAAVGIYTVAQWAMNAAMMACPLTWIILAIGVAIGLVILLAQKIAKAGGVATTAFGVIAGWINVVIQFFKNFGLTVANVCLAIYAAVSGVGYNIITAFKNAILSVEAFWYDLLSTVLSVVEGICAALNKIPFIEFDYSGVTNKAQEYANKAAAARDAKGEYVDIGEAVKNGWNTFDTFQSGWARDAYNAGAKWGDDKWNSIDSKLSELTSGSLAGDYGNQLANANSNGATTAKNTGETAKNTASAAKSLSASSEDLKYIREFATQKFVNRFTTAEITVNQTNHNNVSNDMDLDGITERLKSDLEITMASAAEGVHK